MHNLNSPLDRVCACQGCIIRLVTLDEVTDYGGKSDVILGFFLSILGDDIFLTLERIKSNLTYYTTLVHAAVCVDLANNKNPMKYETLKFHYLRLPSLFIKENTII